MNLWKLAWREIQFRKTGFVLGLISVAVAIGTLVAALTLLQAHDLRTEELLALKEREKRAEMDRMEDDYRRIMRALGYNAMILHRDQSLARLRADGYPQVTMPQEFVDELAHASEATYNHLLPVLQQQIEWPEKGMTVIISGTPGQVPVQAKPRFWTEAGYRSPIMPTVPEGAIELGHAIARDLNLSPGDQVELMGEPFYVHRVHEPQGNMDDAMVWANLEPVQRWLSQKGRINAIFALECVCPDADLGGISTQVPQLLPETQVLEFTSRVTARLDARRRAAEAHETAITAERQHRAALAGERRALAAVLVPVILIAAGLWVFFLTLNNVRERAAEIGILRALGVREKNIVAVFLLKALLMGLVGAVAGYFSGVVVGAAWGGVSPISREFVHLLDISLFGAALLLAAGLCAVAGWIPAVSAARQDPAVVLRAD